MADEKPERIDRREFGKRVAVGGSAVVVPSFVGVAAGATSSGEVELETDAFVYTDTSLDIRIYEDTTGDGTADYEQEKAISDGVTTTVYDALTGREGQGNTYWMQLTFATNNPDDETGGSPELNAATITLPEEQTTEEDDGAAGTGEGQGLGELLDNPFVFIFGSVLGAAGLGLASKSMAIAGWGAYLVFVHLALSTGYAMLEQIVYATAALIFIGLGFKLWRLEGGGES